MIDIKKLTLIGFGLILYSNVFAQDLTNQQLSIKVRQLENQISYLMDQSQGNSNQENLDQLRGQIEYSNHQISNLGNELQIQNELLTDKIDKLQKQLDQLSKTKQKKDPQDQAFENAYNQMLKRQTTEAIGSFSDYIKRYYNGKHYSESLYYLGILYLATGKIDDAKAKFKRIADHYPKSIKYPDALVQLGAIYQIEGQKQTAKNYFNQVIKNYPGTQAATRAKSELAKL